MKRICSSIVLGAALVLLSISQSFAEPIHTEIQSRLFRLGYQIDVDGLWGPASSQTLGRFYQERDTQFDGTVGDGVLADLDAAILDQSALRSGRLLPVNANQDANCDSILEGSMYLPLLSVEELEEYQSIPSQYSEPGRHDQFWNSVIRRLFTWSAIHLRDPSNARVTEQLVGQINSLFEAGVATSIADSGISTDGDNETQTLQQAMYLSTLAYAILALQETDASSELQIAELVTNLEALVYSPQLMQSPHFRGSYCQPGASGTCQNHTTSKALLRTLMGFLTGREEEVRAAVDVYRFSIDQLASDGALEVEAVRGAYSWSYYAAGLGHLVGIADLVSRRWFDLWSYENQNGTTIHDAVNFYVNSLEDPTNDQLMWRYARQNRGIDDHRAFSDEPFDLFRHREVVGTKNYHEWLPPYLSAFPNSDAVVRFASSVRNRLPPNLPQSNGLNGWCVYPTNL